MKIFKSLSLLFLVLFFSCKKDQIQENMPSVCEQQIDNLNINQLQYLNSHNSYRMRTYQPLYDFMDKALGLFSKYQQPAYWDYTHETLEVQFDEYNIRSIELDVYHDPEGGHFYHRQGNRLIGEPTESGIEELKAPGLKLFHQPDFDYMTHHYTFKSALKWVKGWSDAHPNHLPLTIIVEPKDNAFISVATQSLPFLTKPKLVTKNMLNEIDKEIKAIFGTELEQVITPDEVRKNHESLETAILTDGWPTLKDARGKILFVLINSGFELSYYLEGHPSLEGRVMFAFSEPGKPECAFTRINNPEKKVEEIQELVSKGYIVRTRADKAPEEGKNGDPTRREAAMKSGAQIVSTDYYRPDPRHQNSEDWTDYSVQFPNKAVAVINPISGGGIILDCPIGE